MPKEGATSWMLHFISTLFLVGAYGNKDRLAKEEPQAELDNLLQSLSSVDESVVSVMESRTNLKRKEIEESLSTDRYFTGPEALQAGIATALYEPEPLSEPEPEETGTETEQKAAGVSGASLSAGTIDLMIGRIGME